MFNPILKLLTLAYLIQTNSALGAAQNLMDHYQLENALYAFDMIQRVNSYCTSYLIVDDIQTANAIYRIDHKSVFCNLLCSRLGGLNYTLPEIDDILRARIKRTGHSNLARDNDLWEAITAIKADWSIREVRVALWSASTNYPAMLEQNQDWQKATNFFKLIDHAQRVTPATPRSAWGESKSNN